MLEHNDLLKIKITNYSAIKKLLKKVKIKNRLKKQLLHKKIINKALEITNKDYKIYTVIVCMKTLCKLLKKQ